MFKGQRLTGSTFPAGIFTAPVCQKYGRWLLLALFGLLLSACGGGSGTSTSGGSGTVGIVLTDAPTSDFTAVNMTITQILLLSDDDGSAPVTLFEGEETINLLSLRDHAELFALRDVPAGSYSKIRLILKQPDGLELVLVSGEKQYPHLPGTGKIDLNPRGSFNVVSGEIRYAHIDIDAEKSIHAHATGNGQYQFRPVIFVDIIDDDFTGKLVRRTGYVYGLKDDYSKFKLCDMPVPLPPISSEDTEETDPMACMSIYTKNASLFGEDGLPMPLDGLAENANVTVVGFLQYEHDDEDDTDIIHHAKLSAEVIELLDGMGNFETLEGTVAIAPADALSSFDLTLNNSPTIASLLQEGTKVFGRDGTRLDYSDIQPDTLASVNGVRGMMDTTEVLRSSLVILDTTATTSLEKLSSTVNSVNTVLNTVNVATRSGDQVLQLTADTIILLVGDTATGLESSDADIDTLVTGATVDVYGQTGALGYFIPEVILILG